LPPSSAKNSSRAPSQPDETNGCDGRPVVLSTHRLTKDFKELRAVDQLDISVCRGDVFGFLGPNGAGKTTTIRMIFGLIYPTSGHVDILGHRVPEDRLKALRHVGGFVDIPSFYPNMSGRRNLRLFGRMSGEVSDARINEVLDLVGLGTRGDSRVRSYSHGMRQRLGIASGLLNEPEILILDEPTSGLDPIGMRDVRELIRALGRSGTTVFLSSHLLHEVEQVCNRAVIMNKGRVVVEGPVSALRPGGMAVKIMTGDQRRAAEVLRPLLAPAPVADDGEYLLLTADDNLVPELVRRLVAEHIDVRAVVPAFEQGLEDFFLQLTMDGADSAPTGSGADFPAASGRPPQRGEPS
jgi:ABC-type multidrug transport system ATPase subunit